MLQGFLSPREAILDVLTAVHTECKSSDKLKRDKFFSSFITKYDALVEELKKLGLTKDDFEPRNVIGRGHFGEVSWETEASVLSVCCHLLEIIKLLKIPPR